MSNPPRKFHRFFPNKTGSKRWFLCCSSFFAAGKTGRAFFRAEHFSGGGGPAGG